MAGVTIRRRSREDATGVGSKEDGSKPSRSLKSDMLLAATRTFAAVERPDRATCDQFREAFYLLIGQADTATRQKVATLLSRTPFCPRPIALYLAMDTPAVAMPVLRNSTALGQLDFAQILGKRGAVHARLLAARADLPPSIVESLRALDDADVTAALASNREIVGRTVEMRTAGNRDLQIDAHEEVAETRRAAEQRLVQALDRRKAAPTAKAPAMDADTFRVAMETGALTRDRAAMTKAMKARLNLDHATCCQVLDDRSGNALLVMMKAEGFAADMAHRIVITALPTIGLSPEAAERALALWERLEEESCCKALAQWPRAETEATTLATQHQTDDASGIRRETARPAARETSHELRRTG